MFIGVLIGKDSCFDDYDDDDDDDDDDSFCVCVQKGIPVVMFAVAEGHIDVVRFLLRNGVSANSANLVSFNSKLLFN